MCPSPSIVADLPQEWFCLAVETEDGESTPGEPEGRSVQVGVEALQRSGRRTSQSCRLSVCVRVGCTWSTGVVTSVGPAY